MWTAILIFFPVLKKLFDTSISQVRGTPFLRATAPHQRKRQIEDLCRQCEDYFNVKGVRNNLIRSSVILLPREVIERFFHDKASLFQDIFTSLLGQRGGPSLGSDRHHLDEFAWAIFLTHLKIPLTPFTPGQIWEKSDYITRPSSLPILSHYGSEHTRRFYHWVKGRAS